MSFLIYGAYGYTGELIARLAVDRGLRPTLAGRNPEKLAALADELELPHHAFSLDDTAALTQALAEVSMVMHCAGPFMHTAAQMAAACLKTSTHYLDVTGEIVVFEQMAAQSAKAEAAGVMLLPGTGFDVVPTDCLAAYLKQRLPDATHLELAFYGLGRVSRGTATTMVENLNQGGAIRRAGKITRVPTGWQTRAIDFGRGPRTCITIPWGDVSTAYHSTGIPNIRVYSALPRPVQRMMRWTRGLGGVLGSAPVQRFLKRKIQQQPPGPNEEERKRGKTFVWGEVRNAAGDHVVARLTGPEGYWFTALTAVAITERVLAGDAKPGFQTPASAFGADFVLTIDSVQREDVT